MEFYIVLDGQSKSNFLLTRLSAIQVAGKENGLKVHVLPYESLSKFSNLSGSYFYFPYVVFQKIKSDLYWKLKTTNTIIIAGGDENLDYSLLQFFASSVADLYIVYSKYLKKIIGRYFDNLAYIPEGFSTLHLNGKIRSKTNEIIYIGSPFLGRIKIIKSLLDAGYKVDIYGPGSWKETELATSYKGFLDNSEYYQTISVYKIFLSLSSGNHPFVCHPNAKLGDAISANTIALSEFNDNILDEYPLSLNAIQRVSSLEEFILYAGQILAMPEIQYNELVSETYRKALLLDINYELSFNQLFKSLRHKKAEPLTTGEIESVNKFTFNKFMHYLALLQILEIKYLLKWLHINEELYKKLPDVLYYPLVIHFKKKRVRLNTVSVIKINLNKKRISFCLKRHSKNKNFFLPDLKIASFNFFKND